MNENHKVKSTPELSSKPVGMNIFNPIIFNYDNGNYFYKYQREQDAKQ